MPSDCNLFLPHQAEVTLISVVCSFRIFLRGVHRFSCFLRKTSVGAQTGSRRSRSVPPRLITSVSCFNATKLRQLNYTRLPIVKVLWGLVCWPRPIRLIKPWGLRHANNGPSRDQEVFTWAAVARNGRREVDGMRQHTNVFRYPSEGSRDAIRT